MARIPYLMILLLVWQIPKTLDIPLLSRITMPMAAALSIPGLILILRSRLYRRPIMAALMLAAVWMGGTSLLRGTLMEDLYTYVPFGCAALYCFPWAVTYEGDMKRLTGGWSLWMAFLCAAALYAAFTGTHLNQTAWNRFIGINAGDNRLYIMDYCTNAAGTIMASILLVVCAMHTCRRRQTRCLYGAAAAVMLCALSLTDARTSFIGLGVGLGVICCIRVWHGLNAAAPVRCLASFGSALCVLLLTYLAVSRLTALTGSFVPGSRSSLLPVAVADNGVTHRAIGSGSLLTYRDDVWRGLLTFLRSEPQVLLTGTGPAHLMERVMPYVVSEQAYFDHPHSILLQLLGAYGIPGLLIALCFLAQWIRAAWRLLFSPGVPMGQRLLPVPAIAVLVCELAECLTLGRVNNPILILLFLSFGFTINACRSGAVPVAPAGPPMTGGKGAGLPC